MRNLTITALLLLSCCARFDEAKEREGCQKAHPNDQVAADKCFETSILEWQNAHAWVARITHRRRVMVNRLWQAGAIVPETTVREWLALLATLAASLSALFAGLIWWMRLIEAISVRRRLGILVNNTSGAHLAEMAGQEALQQATPALQTSYRREVETEQSAGWTMLIQHDNEFRSCKTVSITLHILKKFPVIRHKKKQITAILPEAMRDRAG